MKILVINDPHVTSSPPQGCKSVYTEDVFSMLTECRDIAITKKVEVTVFTGDMFHYKRDEPYSTVNRLIDLLNSWPGHKLAIVGNHDLSFKGLQSIDDQPIGTLFRGPLDWLEKDRLVAYNGDTESYVDPLFLPTDAISVLWSPANYVDGIDQHPERLEILDKRGADWAIKVAHCSIVLPGKTYPFDCISMDQVPVDNTDLFLYGHLHHYTGIHTVNGCTFAGLGSLGRTQRADYNYMRDMRVLLVELTKEEMTLTEMQLQSAVSPEDLFYSKEVKDTTVEDAMKEFVRHMDRVSQLEETSLDEALSIVLEKHTHPAVVRKVKKHLGDSGW